MKKLKSLFLFAASLMLILSTSCNSSSDEPQTTNQTQTESGSYWPSKINNVWNYSTNGGLQQPTKIISNSDGYFQFGNYLGSNNSTSAQAQVSLKYVGGSYFIKYGTINISANGFTGTQTGFEVIILKDNVPVGTVWNSDYSQTTTYATLTTTIPSSTVFKGTILGKDISLVVGTTTYNDVIHVKINQTVSSAGTISSAVSDYWFSKNVGLIKYINITGNVTYTNLLTSYTLF